jgi:hypothetical protein
MSGVAMKRPGRVRFVWVVACMLATIIAQAGAAIQTFKLSGQVFGSSRKSVVYVALWQADGLLERPMRQVRLEPEPVAPSNSTVPPVAGLSTPLRDRNGNGVLDMGLFLPKATSGFWRPFTGRHKPRFDEVAAFIERDTDDATLSSSSGC